MAVADPGFPVGGGRRAAGGATTSDVGTFRQKCMRKRKNWILLGGRAPAAPPGSATVWANQKCTVTYLSNLLDS